MRKIYFTFLILWSSMALAENHGNSTVAERPRMLADPAGKGWNWTEMQTVNLSAEDAKKVLRVLKRLNSYKRAIKNENGESEIIHWVERVRCRKAVVVTNSSLLNNEPSFDCFFNDAPNRILGGIFAKDVAEPLEKLGAVSNSYKITAVPTQEATITDFFAQQLICAEPNGIPKCTFITGKK